MPSPIHNLPVRAQRGSGESADYVVAGINHTQLHNIRTNELLIINRLRAGAYNAVELDDGTFTIDDAGALVEINHQGEVINTQLGNIGNTGSTLLQTPTTLGDTATTAAITPNLLPRVFALEAWARGMGFKG